MEQLKDGQCGLCIHFGEHDQEDSIAQLVRIRTTHEAPATLVEECGHPNLCSLHLQVTPTSSCDGFEPIPA